MKVRRRETLAARAPLSIRQQRKWYLAIHRQLHYMSYYKATHSDSYNAMLSLLQHNQHLAKITNNNVVAAYCNEAIANLRTWMKGRPGLSVDNPK